MSDIAAQMDNNTMSNHHAHAVATGYALSLRVDHQMNKTIKVVVFKALNIWHPADAFSKVRWSCSSWYQQQLMQIAKKTKPVTWIKSPALHTALEMLSGSLTIMSIH